MSKIQCAFCSEMVDADEINNLNGEYVCDTCVIECEECGFRTDPTFAEQDGEWIGDSFFCDACLSTLEDIHTKDEQDD